MADGVRSDARWAAMVDFVKKVYKLLCRFQASAIKEDAAAGMADRDDAALLRHDL